MPKKVKVSKNLVKTCNEVERPQDERKAKELTKVPNLTFRVLAKGEDVSNGCNAKDTTNMVNTLFDHVANGKLKTRFISATWSIEVAARYANSASGGIIVIDNDRLAEYGIDLIDISTKEKALEVFNACGSALNFRSTDTKETCLNKAISCCITGEQPFGTETVKKSSEVCYEKHIPADCFKFLTAREFNQLLSGIEYDYQGKDQQVWRFHHYDIYRGDITKKIYQKVWEDE